jgi:hypothetical protein
MMRQDHGAIIACVDNSTAIQHAVLAVEALGNFDLMLESEAKSGQVWRLAPCIMNRMYHADGEGAAAWEAKCELNCSTV